MNKNSAVPEMEQLVFNSKTKRNHNKKISKNNKSADFFSDRNDRNWNETFCNMKWTNSSRTGGTTLHGTDGNSGGTSTSNATQNGGGFMANGNGSGAGDRRSIFYTNDVDSLRNGNSTKVRTLVAARTPNTRVWAFLPVYFHYLYYYLSMCRTLCTYKLAFRVQPSHQRWERRHMAPEWIYR